MENEAFPLWLILVGISFFHRNHNRDKSAEKRERGKTMQRDRRRDTADFILIGSIVSFLGWLMETVFAALPDGRFYDRGFLTLPFCPIYGLSVLAVFFLLGTPREGGLLFKRVHRFALRLPLYFLLAVLIPTAAELVTGRFFVGQYGRRLWNYGGYSLSFGGGHICLWFSLLWGVLITLFMWFVFPALRRLVARLSSPAARLLAVLLVLALATDALLNFGRYL